MSGTTHYDCEQQQKQQHHVYSWRNEARTDTSNFLLLFSLNRRSEWTHLPSLVFVTTSEPSKHLHRCETLKRPNSRISQQLRSTQEFSISSCNILSILFMQYLFLFLLQYPLLIPLFMKSFMKLLTQFSIMPEKT